jgi:hypothetical protein
MMMRILAPVSRSRSFLDEAWFSKRRKGEIRDIRETVKVRNKTMPLGAV